LLNINTLIPVQFNALIEELNQYFAEFLERVKRRQIYHSNLLGHQLFTHFLDVSHSSAKHRCKLVIFALLLEDL